MMTLGATLGEPPPGGHKPEALIILSWAALIAPAVALWLTLQFIASLVLRLVERLLGTGKPATFSRTSLVARLAFLALLPATLAVAEDWRTTGPDTATLLIPLLAALALPLAAIWLILRKPGAVVGTP
jgi:hypothetical protein